LIKERKRRKKKKERRRDAFVLRGNRSEETRKKEKKKRGGYAFIQLLPNAGICAMNNEHERKAAEGEKKKNHLLYRCSPRKPQRRSGGR